MRSLLAPGALVLHVSSQRRRLKVYPNASTLAGSRLLCLVPRVASPLLLARAAHTVSSNPSIERTSKSRPRYSTLSLLLPRGLLSAAAHVKR